MDPNLYFVFSQKPEWVSRDDYHAWYVDHAQENIESPGFLNAQRYVTREVQNGRAVGGEQHLCVYQYEGDMKTWRDSLSDRIKTGDIVLKDWHYDIAFRSWTCAPVGGLLTPKTH
jgi:hypothetical protein